MGGLSHFMPPVVSINSDYNDTQVGPLLTSLSGLCVCATRVWTRACQFVCVIMCQCVCACKYGGVTRVWHCVDMQVCMCVGAGEGVHGGCDKGVSVCVYSLCACA